MRTHKTVELAVIQCHKFILEIVRLLFKPLGKAVAYLINLGMGKLDSLGIGHLDVVALVVFAD